MFRSMGLLFRRIPEGAVSGLGIEVAVFYYALARGGDHAA
jgi:hypothetical protein